MRRRSSTLGHSASSVRSAGVPSSERGYDTGGYGSIWRYDTPTGTVVRWDGQTHDVASDIHVTAPADATTACA